MYVVLELQNMLPVELNTDFSLLTLVRALRLINDSLRLFDVFLKIEPQTSEGPQAFRE